MCHVVQTATMVTVLLLQVSNLNSLFSSSFHIRHRSHVAVGNISTNNGWMMSNHRQPGEPSDYHPLSFFNNRRWAMSLTAMWQATTIVQPPSTTTNVAISYHTTPNDAANNKDKQPTTTATHYHPLTKTNQHQSNQPQASTWMTTSTHKWTQITMSWGKACSPPPYHSSF